MHLSEFTILTGILLVILGVPFLSSNVFVQAKVLSFPRSRLLAYILMVTGVCWFLFGHVMQLGEADFGEYKTIIVLISICILFSAFFLTKDFLAVRALSILILLYSREVLDAAFLQEPSARLFFGRSNLHFNFCSFILGRLSIQNERFFNLYLS